MKFTKLQKIQKKIFVRTRKINGHTRTRTHLSQVHHRLRQVAGPGVGAARAGVARLPVLVHDGLQDGSEGSDTDARGYENCVLCPENVA